jgi:predicted RNA-binding Zn-ribbon protein involved in translation (DUF1610 family)
MDSSDSRREVMNSYERIFARICLEYGWAGRSQIADAVRARSKDPANASASLSFLLVSRGVLTQEQAKDLEDKCREVTRSGVYADVREDDTGLGQLLIEAGSATPEQIHSALEQQKEFAARKAPVPRLGEILIDLGVVTFAKLQESVDRQSKLVRLACPSCGSRYAAEASGSTPKAYLCKKCASPLAGTDRRQAPPAATEPEEVLRAAENPKNILGSSARGRWARSIRRGTGACAAGSRSKCSWPPTIRSSSSASGARRKPRPPSSIPTSSPSTTSARTRARRSS